MKIYIAHHCW